MLGGLNFQAGSVTQRILDYVSKSAVGSLIGAVSVVFVTAIAWLVLTNAFGPDIAFWSLGAIYVAVICGPFLIAFLQRSYGKSSSKRATSASTNGRARRGSLE